MNADNVIEKILADAAVEAEKIKKQAQEKETIEQAKLDEQLVEYRKQTNALAKKAAEDEKLHLLAAARMQMARELLAEKRKMLDEVFEQARRQLMNLPDDRYHQLTVDLMLKAVETGDEEVIIGKDEKRIDQQLINQVNERLRSGGTRPGEAGRSREGNLTLSDKRQELDGGFILKRGKIKNNASLEVLLAQARRNLEIELAKEMFVK